MAQANLYRIKDMQTNQYLDGLYRCTQVQKICGLNCDVSGYARKGHIYAGRWKIEIADSEALASESLKVEKNVLGWEAEWCLEWDKARLKLLKAYGKA